MRTSLVNAYNAGLLDATYERWKKDPSSVDATWSAFFEGFELGFLQPKTAGKGTDAGAASTESPLESEFQAKVEGMVYAYRTLGHSMANLDPLGLNRREQPLLGLEALGFTETDLDKVVASRSFRNGEKMTLREMIDRLKAIYCDTIGVEYMHIQNPAIRDWVRDRVEARPDLPPLPPEEQKAMLLELLEAEAFEQFLHTRYVGQKRFSLEGGESLMVALDGILELLGLEAHPGERRRDLALEVLV